MGISLGPQDMVTVEPYEVLGQSGQSYLGNMEVEVGFATRKSGSSLLMQRRSTERRVTRVAYMLLSLMN